jgi:hypothetical protein
MIWAFFLNEPEICISIFNIVVDIADGGIFKRTMSVRHFTARQQITLKVCYSSTFSFKTRPTNRLYMVRAKVLTDLPEVSGNASPPCAACSAKAASANGGGRR